jgi:small subunit ribosomal protein S2
MERYIFGARNGVHIINLDKTAPLLKRALQAIHDVVANGGHALLVGTKKQARQAIADAALQSHQYYINHRWLGGTLTNWQTISQSITHLKELSVLLDDSENLGLTKRELLSKEREFNKLNQILVGIKDMPGRPDIIFVIDTNIDHISIKEAKKLGIPVVAIVDTNSSLDGIDYPIPGNDDAGRAINLYCDLLTSTIVEGLSSYINAQNQDVGSQEKPFESEAAPQEETNEETPETPTQEENTTHPPDTETAPQEEATS